MGYWAKLLFKMGYLPIEHAAVKREFLDWYYQASKNYRVIQGLDLDNSELTRYALIAAESAENLDDEQEVVELIDIIDKQRSRASTILTYGFVISVLLGFGLVGAGMSSFESLLATMLATVAGGALSGGALVVFGIYHILAHQIRSNMQLIRMFNEELTEKPGDIRRYDREWEQLAAQYFWNKSLCNPKTIVAVLVLSIVRLFSKRIYGRVAADLHYNITEYIEMDAKEVLKHQYRRIKTGDYDFEHGY